MAVFAATRSSRAKIVLVALGFFWFVVVIGAVVWRMLPRWAPGFTISHAPLPDMIFRAAIDGGGSSKDAGQRLVSMGKRATATLMPQLHHSDEKVRSFALMILGQIKDPDAIAAIGTVLGDPRESLHGLAIKTLAQIGDARAIPHVVPFLSNKTLGFEAADALRALPATPVANALQPLIERREIPTVLYALYDNQDPRVLSWLDAEMRIEAPVLVGGNPEFIWQEFAAMMLGINMKMGGGDLLAKALTDPSPAIRTRGAFGLVQRFPIGLPEEVRRSVIHLLADPDVSVITAAAKVCNYHELEDSIPILLRLLDSPNPTLRTAGTHGFGNRLLNEQALEKLVSLIRDPDEQVRTGAVTAIAWAIHNPNNSSKRLFPILVPVLSDVSAKVRKAAMFGLGNCRDSEVTAAIVSLLDDPDHDLRNTALQHLTNSNQMLTPEQQAKVHAARANIPATR